MKPTLGIIAIILCFAIVIPASLADVVTYGDDDSADYGGSGLIELEAEETDSEEESSANNTTAGLEINTTKVTEGVDDLIGGIKNLTEGLNTTEIGEKLANMTETGVGPVDSISKWLIDLSPILLLILGVVLVLVSGFGKMIGFVLIALAVIRILWELFL